MPAGEAPCAVPHRAFFETLSVGDGALWVDVTVEDATLVELRTTGGDCPQDP